MKNRLNQITTYLITAGLFVLIAVIAIELAVAALFLDVYEKLIKSCTKIR